MIILSKYTIRKHKKDIIDTFDLYPSEFMELKNILKSKYHEYESIEKINKIIRGHGVCAMVLEDDCYDDRDNKKIIDYVNMGDTYNLTVIRYKKRLYLGTWADLAEKYLKLEG